MKRLFVLVNMQGKKYKGAEGQVLHFGNKMEAKELRNALNDDLGRVEWRISRGIDNKKSPKPHGRTVSGLPKYQRGNRGHF